MSHKTGRNDRCPCGSGRKYKNCCMNAGTSSPDGARLRVESGGADVGPEAGRAPESGERPGRDLPVRAGESPEARAAARDETSPGASDDGRSVLDVVLDERAATARAASAASKAQRRRVRTSRGKAGRADPAVRAIDGRIWRLYCSIEGIRPFIWRRIEVSGKTTLRTLHHILQEAFGWQNAHLHAFERGDFRWGEPDPDGLLDFIDDRTTRLADVLPETGDGMTYEYDFGDAWRHIIGVERIFAPGDPSAYPRLVDGRRACPPEDSGGPWFYDELLEVIADPDHPDHQERIDWLGDNFDPEEFDVEAADRRLARFRTTSITKPARARRGTCPSARDARDAAHQDATDASGRREPASVNENAAADNFRAVLAAIDQAAGRRPFDPIALDAARRLLQAHAAAEPGDLARLHKPAVWAAGALHAAFTLADPDTAPTAAHLAAVFGVSTAAVASRSRLLRRHAPALQNHRKGDDAADDSRPYRGPLRLL